MDPLSEASRSPGQEDVSRGPPLSVLEDTQFFEANPSTSALSTFGGGLGPSDAPWNQGRPGMSSQPRSSVGGGVPSSSGGGQSAAAYLEISVSDPVKQGDGVQAYVSYKVNTKTSLPTYRFPQFSVIRRFSDFSWLHDRLAEKNKGIIIPPLPEKSVVEKFRFSAEFIETRRRALDSFVNRIAVHPQLQLSTDLQQFLEASEEVWGMETSRAGESVLPKSNDIFQMFKDVQTRVSNVVLGKDAPRVEVDEEYEGLKKYVIDLEGHLGECRKQADRLVKRQREMGQALQDFSVAMINQGNCELPPLSRLFSEVGNRSDLLASKTQKHAQDLLMGFAELVKEYVRMVHSIKAVMADRYQASAQHQQLLAEVEAKKGKLVKTQVAMNVPNKQEKVTELEKDISDTERKAEQAKERHMLIVERMRAEMARFHAEKANDLLIAMQKFASVHAALSADTVGAWASLLPEIQAARTSAASVGAV